MVKNGNYKNKFGGGNEAMLIMQQILTVVNKHLKKYEDTSKLNSSTYQHTKISEAFRKIVDKNMFYKLIKIDPYVGKRDRNIEINTQITHTLNDLDQTFKELEKDGEEKLFINDIERGLLVTNGFIKSQYINTLIDALHYLSSLNIYRRYPYMSDCFYYFAKKAYYLQKILNDLEEFFDDSAVIIQKLRIYYSTLTSKLYQLYDKGIVDNIVAKLSILKNVNAISVSNVIQENLQLPTIEYDSTVHFKKFHNSESTKDNKKYYESSVIYYIEEEHDKQIQMFLHHYRDLYRKISAIYGEEIARIMFSQITQKVLFFDKDNQKYIVNQVIKDALELADVDVNGVIEYMDKMYESKFANISYIYQQLLSEIETMYDKNIYDNILNKLIGLHYINPQNVGDIIKKELKLDKEYCL